MANNLSQTAYADHLRGCSDLAVEIADRMGLREDSARQATFATVIINAERHNLFLEPVPRKVRTTPKTAGRLGANGAGGDSDNAESGVSDAKATDDSEAGDAMALKEAVRRACRALNDAGYTPPLTPSTLEEYIQKETQLGKPFAEFDDADMEALIKNLTLKRDDLVRKGESK